MFIQVIRSLQTLATDVSYSALSLKFGQTAIENNLPGATAGDASTNFGALITQILNIVLVIAVVAVLFFLIIGAIEWITAGGDSSKTQKAREKMTNAVIGLVVLVSVVAIMMFVQQLLGICVINFSGSCSSNTSSVPAPVPAITCTTSCRTVDDCSGVGVLAQGTCGVGFICCSR